MSLNVCTCYSFIAYCVDCSFHVGVSPRPMSTSSLSKIFLGDYFSDTFTCGFTQDSIQYALFIQENDKASLCELSRMYGQKNDTSSEEDAARALLTQMLTDEEDFRVEMTKDNEVEMFKVLELPDISTRVKPDLALVCDGYVALVEVESETYIHTVRKMCFVLMLHLLCLKISFF